MLSQEQNDLVTRAAKGTPGGELLRRYWQPVALEEELPPGAPPKPVRIMGEDLVVFRDQAGRPGLLGLHCPHRKADLSYGRIEDGGLRCVYHGWLFGVDGRCLHQPGEPAHSDFKDKIRHTAYPCRDVPGLILAYLGPGEPPALPPFPFFSAPREQVWTKKFHHECNYLQGNEGNIDPQHLSILHRIGMDSVLSNARFEADLAPAITVSEMPWGLRIDTTRLIGDSEKYVRTGNFIMPNLAAFVGGPLVRPEIESPEANTGYSVNWHVPIDDRTHWKFAINYRGSGPVDVKLQEMMMCQGLDADYRMPRNRRNRYLQDREEMRTSTFIGMGTNFYDHDRWVVESQGDIVDRTTENLATTDRAVVLMRRHLLRAIDDIRRGCDPLLVHRKPEDYALGDFFTGSKMERVAPAEHEAVEAAK
ncbi:MAG TPA: aromatic ring-hydroxylating dioxygenase subunit alpha [Stellaceae bacterium]|nr:aromatic ring-hydroxylating dioxygenase subunit alpha [Stellaceae bacterium]